MDSRFSPKMLPRGPQQASKGVQEAPKKSQERHANATAAFIPPTSMSLVPQSDQYNIDEKPRHHYDTLMVAMNLAALHHERGEYGKAEVCA